MALNWVTIVDNRPLLLQGETFIDSGTIDNVRYNLTIPDAPPSASSSAGGSGGLKRLEAVGTVALTDQRLVWTNPDANSSFKSLTIPLASILSTKFELPIFGANYLVISIKPTHDGGLTEGSMLEIRFVNRGMVEFVGKLEKARQQAIIMKRRSMEYDDHLPAYTSPSTSSTAAPAPYSDMPPGYDS